MPIIRLTRRGTIGQCNCKVGGCRKCGSACRRCKCACDGISPLDALQRRVGKHRKKAQLNQGNEKDKNEAPKKRNLDEKSKENEYTRKLRKRPAKQPIYNEVRHRKSTGESTYIAPTDTEEATCTLASESVNAKGSKRAIVGYKDLRQIQECQVIDNDTNSDTSPVYYTTMQTDGSTGGTTLTDDDKTTVNNETKSVTDSKPEPE